MAIILVTAILVVALVLLITELVPVDVTGLGLIVILAVTGLLEPDQAVLGFANPAVVTVAAMFVLSAGMIRTGALNFVGRAVTDAAGGRPRRAMVMTLLIVAVASAFINNTPIVVLFIPIIMTMACTYDMSPSRFLIPLSYASILAGTCTLIGTSTNIILSDLMDEHGLDELGMFELATLGVPIAVLGITFICLTAQRLLPSHAAPTCDSEDREDRRYLAELIVPEGSSLIGRRHDEVLQDRSPTLDLFEVIRDHQIVHPEDQTLRAEVGDILLVKGSPNDFVALLERGELMLPHAVGGRRLARSNQDHVVAELIIPPQSKLLGERLADTDFYAEEDLEVVAVRIRGIHHSEQMTTRLRLRVGTILLVQCSPQRLEGLRRSSDFIIVEEVHREIVRKDKAWRALVIFAGVVVAASTGLASIMLASLAGGVLMIFSRCMSLRDAYRALQGQVLVLIAGTIALGRAMEQTGAAQLYAEGALSLLQGAPTWVVLSALILLTSVSTQVLSNNATAVLLFPIALSAAEALGLDARPFIIGVCFGASACFATPIGYQTNLLVYGPGGYRFSDFLKLGLPLNLLVWVMGTAFIPMIWPF